jgi:hypothetical protein
MSIPNGAVEHLRRISRMIIIFLVIIVGLVPLPNTSLAQEARDLDPLRDVNPIPDWEPVVLGTVDHCDTALSHRPAVEVSPRANLPLSLTVDTTRITPREATLIYTTNNGLTTVSVSTPVTAGVASVEFVVPASALRDGTILQYIFVVEGSFKDPQCRVGGDAIALVSLRALERARAPLRHTYATAAVEESAGKLTHLAMTKAVAGVAALPGEGNYMEGGASTVCAYFDGPTPCQLFPSGSASDHEEHPPSSPVLQAIDVDLLDPTMAQVLLSTCASVTLPASATSASFWRSETSSTMASASVYQGFNRSRAHLYQRSFAAGGGWTANAFAHGLGDLGYTFRIENAAGTAITSRFKIEMPWRLHGFQEALAHDYFHGVPPSDPPEAEARVNLRMAWRNVTINSGPFEQQRFFDRRRAQGGIGPGIDRRPAESIGTQEWILDLRHYDWYRFSGRLSTVAEATAPYPAQVGGGDSDFYDEDRPWRLTTPWIRITSLTPNVRFVC